MNIMSQRKVRYTLIAAVATAVSLPWIGQLVNAKDAPAAQEPAAQAQQAKQAQPKSGGAGEPAVVPADEEGQPTAKAAPKVAPDAVVLSVGDEKITAAEFDAFIADLPPQVQMMAQGEGRRKVAEDIVKMKLLAAEGRQRGLAKNAEVQRKLKNVEEQLLIGALAEELAKGDAAKKHYEANKGKYGQVKARHILVSTRGGGDPFNPDKKGLTDAQALKKAQDIRARLTKGEDFAKIAKAESDDPGSKDTGGEYTFGRGQMVAEFEKAAFGQKKGEISQPVKTQFGYHVIQTMDLLPAAYDEVKQQIVRDMLEQIATDRQKGAQAEYNEAYFGPAAPAEKPAADAGAAAPDKNGKPAPAANAK